MVPPPSIRLRAFTLIELLITIAIIAVLVAVLLPVFGAVRKKQDALKCVANQRQLAAALQLYAADNNHHLPSLWYQNAGGVIWYYSPDFNSYLGPQGDKRVAFGMCPSWDGAKRNGVAGSATYPPKTYNSYTFCYPAVVYAGGVYSVAAQYGDTPLTIRYGRPATTLLICDSAPSPDATSYTAYDSMPIARTTANFLSNEHYTATRANGFRHAGRINATFFDGHSEALLPGQIKDGMLIPEQDNPGTTGSGQ